MKFFRPIISLAFAVLVFFSGSRFMVGIHYCGGHVQDVSIFSPAEKCAMEKEMPPCHKHQAKSCCDDQNIVHDTQDFQHTLSTLNLVVPFFIDIPATSVVLSEIIPAHALPDNQRDAYSPPVRPYDRTIAQQVFRI